MLKRFIYQLAFCALFFSSVAESVQSPFFIPFEPKKDLTEEDIVCVQKLISEVSIETGLRALYAPLNNKNYTSFDDFLGRCSREIRQKLIDREKGLCPKQELIKIGNGGNRCLVCSVPVGIQGIENESRMQLASTIRKSLEDTGFNGYLLTFIGGFPNPTGIEICYAAVPYSFKIFAMVEAYQLGFDNVIWIDAACLPINDPTPLFDYIDVHETLFCLHAPSCEVEKYKYIFPQTRAHLMKLTGVDVLRSNYLVTIVFGLKMSSQRVKKLVDQ